MSLILLLYNSFHTWRYSNTFEARKDSLHGDANRELLSNAKEQSVTAETEKGLRL